MSSATQQCQQNKVKVALFIPVGKFGLPVKKRAFTEEKTDTQTKITHALSTSESATKLCYPLVALQQFISTDNGCRNKTVPVAVGSALGNFEPLSGGKQLKCTV